MPKFEHFLDAANFIRSKFFQNKAKCTINNLLLRRFNKEYNYF